jgi:hypothetical protein
MASQIVRYPRAIFWVPIFLLAISVFGLVKAINGTERWTFPDVAVFAVPGVFLPDLLFDFTDSVFIGWNTAA